MLIFLHSPLLIAKDDERPSIPDVSYPDLSGESHNLQQWKGRVVLLNFWASWCAPCLAEIRYLIEYQDKYGPQGLQVIGLGLDDPRKLKNVKRSLGINYPVLAVNEKQSRAILKAWGNKTGLVPYTVVFDREGKVVRSLRGLVTGQQFTFLVKPLLGHAGQ